MPWKGWDRIDELDSKRWSKKSMGNYKLAHFVWIQSKEFQPTISWNAYFSSIL